MKTIKLLNLKMLNFKGIKEFELSPGGEDTRVFGENATGKTTIFDAFVWLLFDKDSRNKKDFGIKTLKDGEVVHNLNHEVEGTFLIDGKELTLKKVFTEKWTKKRGSEAGKFGGHTTKHHIDGVPANKKEFTDRVAEIVEEGVFKLLTSPPYFNEQIHWKDRRDLLLEIAGDIDNEEIIKTDKKLSKLKAVLDGGRSLDDHKKVIAEKKKEINQELDRIPTRIDEINRNLPDLSGLDEKKIKNDIDMLSFEIEAKNKQLNDINNGSEVNELKKKISDIDLQISNVRNEHTQNEQEETFKLKTKLQEEQSNRTIMRGDLRGYEQRKASNESLITEYEKQMQDLRDEFIESQEQYKEQDAIEFNHEDECICPTCEQDLPEEQIESTKAKFNSSKSRLLESITERQADINKKGKELKEKVGELQEENESIQKDIDKVTDQGIKKASDIEKLEAKIEKAESTVTPIEENDKYIKLTAEKTELEKQVEEMDQSVESSLQSVREEIDAINKEQDKLRTDLSLFTSSKQSQERIVELEEQEKVLGEEYEELEKQLHLTEVFTRTKVNMLTEKINSKFKYARFNLFKENINGGLEEICETTYDGVPYGSGLNDGHKIIVGLDIIDTLSEHYGVQAPIFVDNAESVTEPLSALSQIISLAASKGEKKLKVESKSESVVA